MKLLPTETSNSTIISPVPTASCDDPLSLHDALPISPEVIEQLRRNFGLDEPLGVRYVRWLGAFLTGNFGYSFGHGRPVWDVRSEEHTSELQSRENLVCRLLLVKKNSTRFRCITRSQY